jgi:uncharacterized membrane protein (DUF373 family)
MVSRLQNLLGFSEYQKNYMLKLSDKFEKLISSILLGFAMCVVVYQIIALFWNAINAFAARFKQVGMHYAPEYTKGVAILFFNILLMLEIMQTIKVFAHNHLIKVRIILIVCLIAVSRKILAVGEETSDPMEEFALAALILSLGASYFLVSRFTKEPVEETNE